MKNKGFTIIELMVTVTIMLIMTAAVLFNYDRFNESTLIGSLAYDVSLTIRQAQVYGVAVREAPGSGSSSAVNPITTASMDNFGAAYGVHFVTTDGATPMSLFADVNADGVYNDVDGDVILQTYKFQRGMKIKTLCVGSAPEHCSNNMDVTFKRPDPQSKISQDQTSYSGTAKIVLNSDDESIEKTILIYPTGQISVQ